MQSLPLLLLHPSLNPSSPPTASTCAQPHTATTPPSPHPPAPPPPSPPPPASPAHALKPQLLHNIAQTTYVLSSNPSRGCALTPGLGLGTSASSRPAAAPTSTPTSAAQGVHPKNRKSVRPDNQRPQPTIITGLTTHGYDARTKKPIEHEVPGQATFLDGLVGHADITLDRVSLPTPTTLLQTGKTGIRLFPAGGHRLLCSTVVWPPDQQMPSVPWADIATSPTTHYDTSTFQLPTTFTAPDLYSTTLGDLCTLAAFLLKTSTSALPFRFRTKEVILRKILDQCQALEDDRTAGDDLDDGMDSEEERRLPMGPSSVVGDRAVTSSMCAQRRPCGMRRRCERDLAGRFAHLSALQNFLRNAQMERVDFGALREYSRESMDKWFRLRQAAALEDRGACAEWSRKLGYLTGEKNQHPITPIKTPSPSPRPFPPAPPPAIAILSDVFEHCEMDKDDIIDWVNIRGDAGEFRWLYASPDAPKGKKGAFQSDLVLGVFARHLKQTSGAMMDYGMPVGGLALCTAAMERALELWANGEDPKKKDAEAKKHDEAAAGKKRCQPIPSFGGDTWISCAAGYVALAQGLTEDEHWLKILSEAEARIPANAATATSTESDVDVRATLSLCSPAAFEFWSPIAADF
ncbi:hypothetical protein FPV67DRAFT_1732286 [Lyophyllum atratum]|nr:hypothetical protein FPV67DRAFT_1732286 [Lyophyllum atratum]